MNTHKNRILYVVILLSVIFFGCKKEWLEAKSDKKQAVPATVKDFQAIIDNFSNINRTSFSFNEVASDGHYYTEGTFSGMLPSNPHFQNTYTWTPIHAVEMLTPTNLTMYSFAYSGILNMNIVLDELKKSKDPDKNGLEQVKAQALFNRSRLLYQLAQTYAPPFKVGTANTDLGLILRLSSDITEKSQRSTVQQTYDQIISDLMAAKDILPNVPGFISRASKPAALGLLAKVYLSMRDYPEAFNYANEYLKIKNTLLNYNTISASANFIGVNDEVSFLNLITNSPSILTANYLVDQSLFDSYDNNDLRKQLFFKVASSGITFKGTYGNSATQLFVGIATDEMYLIRAEGYARAGNLSAAMKDLNDLLRTRWAKNSDGTTKYVDQIATDQINAIRTIINERRKQLILRDVRWTDLRRLNQETTFAVTLIRTIGGQTYTLEPNSDRYTFPFPIEIIQGAGITQNPGWSKQ